MAEGTYLWTGAWSKHIGGRDDLNESQRLLAIEHNNWISGYFKNSFDDDAFFFGKKYTRSLGYDFKASAMIGLNYGYRDSCTDSDFRGEKQVCPMIVPAITYTGYRVQPTIMSIGNAATLSVRWQF